MIRRAVGAIAAILVIAIAINTGVSAGDKEIAERAIEAYARGGLWMLATIGIAISIYIATSGDE